MSTPEEMNDPYAREPDKDDYEMWEMSQRAEQAEQEGDGQPGVWVTKEMLVEISDKFHDMYSLGDMPRDELDGAMRFADALRERMK